MYLCCVLCVCVSVNACVCVCVWGGGGFPGLLNIHVILVSSFLASSILMGFFYIFELL